MISSILKADSAGPAARHLYERSHLLLAGALPLGVFSSQDSTVRKVADYGLAVGIPIHSHIALNYVLADYIPKASQGAARWGVLGLSAVTCAGLLRLNMAGPGVMQTVMDLWKK